MGGTLNCRGCGTELEHEPSLETVNRVLDEVLEKSIEDAVKAGGVCPLCGHSKHLPPSHRKSVQFALLVGCLVLLGLGLAATLYYRNPMRTSLAHQAVERAKASADVRSALGEPIEAGKLARGTVHQDETGWDFVLGFGSPGTDSGNLSESSSMDCTRPARPSSSNHAEYAPSSRTPRTSASTVFPGTPPAGKTDKTFGSVTSG